MAGPGPITAERAKVRRHPYWVPTDNDGKGAWRFLAADQAHRQEMIQQDRESEMIYRDALYESKGWTPAGKLPAGDDRLGLLPTNWKAMCANQRLEPQWSEEMQARHEEERAAAAEVDSDETPAKASRK